MKKRELQPSDIETRFFDHQFREQGAVQCDLVVIRAFDDGYAQVRQFNGAGLMQAQTAWSGCLTATREMSAEVRALAVEARKL